MKPFRKSRRPGNRARTQEEQARFDAIKAGEEWRKVAADPNFEVSSLARVRSLDRVIQYRDGRDRPMKGRIRKPIPTSGSGYHHVVLSGRQHYVHRLVAMAFVDGYAPGLCVNHKDGIRTNNAPENLEWVTSRENSIHARDVLKISYTPPLKGAENKLSREVIGSSVADGTSIRFAALMDAERAGFHAAAICRCCKGAQSVHKGYSWRYADGSL